MRVQIPLLSLKIQIWRLPRARSSLAFRQTIKCGFILKPVRDMIITYSQMHRTDKYSQHSSIIWPVWLNGWVFVYELSGCGFKPRCCHLNFRYGACFEQGVPWHSDIYREWIHSETRTQHDNNIQLYQSRFCKNHSTDNSLSYLIAWNYTAIRTLITYRETPL